jgi:cyclic beta-1,2-glucan synthetase
MNISDLFGIDLSIKSNSKNSSNKNNSSRVVRSQAPSREELAELGKFLATEHKIKTGTSNDRRLYLRLQSNCSEIEKSYLLLSDSAKKKEAITPGAEWLLDNYFIIEKQINEIRHHFPRGYDKVLPRLLEGEYRQYPRVFHLILSYISNNDCVLDIELLNVFLESYQTQAVLQIGEVWAVPIMIRFALLEQLRDLSVRMIQAREELKAAENLVEEILGDESKPGTQILLNLAEKVMLRPDFLAMGAGHLIRRLRDRGRKASLTLQWLEERLREEGRDPEEILKNEQRSLSSDQITIGNIFTSLRSIGHVNWDQWFEQNCKVEHILKLDPSGIYPKCDFKTRDAYRTRLEKLARYSKKSETDIAVAAVNLARDFLSNNENSLTDFRASVGGYLSQRGLPLLENAVDHTPGLVLQTKRFVKKYPFLLYLSSFLIFTIIPLYYAYEYASHNSFEKWQLFLALFLCFIPSTDLGNNITQWLVTRFTTPKLLPKFNFEKGIPEEFKTVVVVHSLFSDRTSAKNTIEGLHVRYLSNDDPNLTYCILADLADSKTETTEKDEIITSYSKQKIQELCDTYGHNRFVVLFRKRIWNAKENCFMAWERKRGKIEEFNKLLLGETDTSFVITEEERAKLVGHKLVITLDNDTQLPRGMAAKLVAAAAHPMNFPIFDKEKQRVIDGYTIIQPRVGVSLTSANTSIFSRIFAGHAGLDPYTQSVSDVYQDLFNEGSYIGKGIYHVKAFEKSMHNRVPENTLLSHDLFEGIFTRVALASDIELYDDFPSKYNAHSKRQHRWIRGDWQLLPWVGLRNPSRQGSLPSRITALGRWKLFDNLRRSLVAPSLFALLTCGTVILPGNPLFWTIFGLLVIAFPVFTNLAQALIIPPRGMSLESHIGGVWKDFSKMFKQTLLTFVFMPHQAFMCLDAILRTVYRMYISRKNLLQWETAYHTERKSSARLSSFFAEMSTALLFIAIGLTSVVLYAPERLPLVVPLYLLWVSSPFIAQEVSKPRSKAITELTSSQREKVREYGFKTWQYFAKYLNKENNFLIPDNFQEVPTPVLAQRTSPTNISLSMLTTLSAYDLGFITSSKAVTLINSIFDGLEKLERYNGHFLNWYKTDTAESLYPRYVSMVDSGNMVGHLIALRSSLKDHKRIPFITKSHLEFLNVYDPVCKDKLTSSIKSEELSIRAAIWYLESLNKLNFEDSNDSQIKNVLESISWLHSFEELAKNEDKDSPIYPSIQAVLSSFNELTLTSEHLKIITDSVEGILKTSNRASEKIDEILKGINSTRKLLDSFKENCEAIIKRATNIVNSIDFRFLYDEGKDLFAIGFNVDAGRRDTSYYDLLASEARLGSLCAIALGQLPERHWFSLGRGLTEAPGGKALLSWTGTMFEYLMPLLVMRSYPGTLLHETYDVVVKAQKSYGNSKNVPWGISESSFSGVDFEKTYQYRAFGVPGLGLKRGLEEDLVISPYSTMLALPVSPIDSLENLERMEKLGFVGEYGFYEAVDYTKNRLAASEKFHIVKNYFAHHQGMSLVAMTNLLTGGIWQDRFHKDPTIQSVDLVLQERFPDRLPVILPHHTAASNSQDKANEDIAIAQRIFKTPNTPYPQTHLLSNGSYTVMVDNSGSGFSLFDKEISLTRWSEDIVQNDMGTHIFIRDLKSKKVWSSGFQPTLVTPDLYEAIFSPDKAEFKRKDYGIFTHQQITVSPEENVEIRKITVANTGKEKRVLELTSFAEVALAPTKADQAHPAFAKMFIQSEYLDEYDALLFSRRPRSKHEEVTYLLHQVIMKTVWDRTYYESSREKFIGRGHSIKNPVALENDSQLSGTVGYVLDPCMSLRVKLEINPGESQTVVFTTAYSKSKEELLATATRYRDTNQVNRAFEVAWSQSSIELRNEQAFGKQASTFQQLANCLMLNVEKVRAPADVIARNKFGQSGLWRFGISGDLPICLVKITEQNQTKIVEQLLHAHHYLRNRGFQFDLIILNEHSGGYLQHAQEEIEFQIRSSFSAPLIDKKGGIFVRNINQLSEEEKDLLQAVARVVLSGLRGTLESQLKLDETTTTNWVPFQKARNPHYVTNESNITVQDKGEFFNGVGSFDEDGKSYSFRINKQSLPPAPWSNVIANPYFGTLVTECGGGYTWSQNSRENRLTPWNNDPVSDPLGEVIYIRDAKTGSFWCPTPKPISLESDVIVHHRFGETEFITTVEAITSTLSISVDPTDSVKNWNIHLTNHSPTPRTLELYLYVNWVLGVQRQDTYTQINSAFDKENSILYATNRYNADFGNRVVFLGSTAEIDGFTASRTEFIGRNRDLSSPMVLAELANQDKSLSKTLAKLSGKVGAGFDSCGVIKVIITVEGNSSTSTSFFLGDAPSIELMKSKVSSYKQQNFAHDSINKSKELYHELVSAVQVQTPNRSFDIMVNGWLLYQTLSCRLWGRTGFYQSGGAFGFRDQLQDSSSLLYTRPDLVRSQIILHAGRQFPEGDVQHWWHPPTGKGVRTKISDDYLWLPLITQKYLEVTNDQSILEERAGFIDGPILPEHEMEAYIVPTLNPHTSTIYEKCLLMLDRSLVWGPNGLPLIGGGDWNDGMNEIGRNGKGESVWMGWFLATVLKKFLPVVEQRKDSARVEKYSKAISHLTESLEKNAWDGQWYRRAYFDDGSPVGSIQSEECKIDSLPQSWSIISGLGDAERSKIAMENVYKYLVSSEHKIIKLFTPPFNTGPQEPGYIKGYLPGVRENGGQYTHASAWVIIATALMGDGEKAVDLFSLINPILHTDTKEGTLKYRCEPYVLCGDVYSAAPHEGRAGWSWYTGSAGWMYQAAVEYIMGLKIRGNYFEFSPTLPASWKNCSMTLKWKGANFTINFDNNSGNCKTVSKLLVNGKEKVNLKVEESDFVSGDSVRVEVVL